MFRLEYSSVIFDSRVLREARSLSQNHELCIIDVLGNNTYKKEIIENIRIERIDLLSKSLPSNLLCKCIKYFEFVIKAVLKGFQEKCDFYHAGKCAGI